MPVAATPGSGARPLSAHRTAQASPLGANRTSEKQQQQQQRGRGSSIEMNKADITGIAERADSLPVTYAGPSSSNPQQQQQQDAADAALYRDMREALADFEAQQRKLAVAGKMAGNTNSSSRSQRPARMPPRQTAFFSALRSVLQQVLAEATPAGRHTRLLAAHAWFVGHRPRPAAADPHLAAAMAASLSVSAPTGQQQQGGTDCARLQSSRCHSPGAAAAGDNSSDDSSIDSGSGFFLEQDACCSYQQQGSTDGALNFSSAAAAVGPRPSSATIRAQRLDAAAKAAFSSSWPHGGSKGGCGGSNGSSDRAEVPGLIPMGALPSSRFAGSTIAAAAGAGAAGALPGSRHVSTVSFACPEQQQQRASSSKAAFSAVTAQQAALEAEVASSLHGYARQWARVEEDISRRQELAAVAAATAATGVAAAAAAAAGGCAGMGCGKERVLQHLDSQHQPSQVTAELALTAAGAAAARVLAGNGSSSPSTAAACGDSCTTAGSSGSGVQLVVADKVKAARRQHMQEGLQECSQLQALNLGLPGDLLARALLPPPDVPYMSAFAQLPAYKPPGKVAGSKKKATKKKQGDKEKMKKGGKSSGSKGKGKAAKPSRTS